MHLLRLFAISGALAMAATSYAAALTPKQQAALQKLLAGVPPEQHALVRPQLEATLAGLTPEQVDLMVAGMKGGEADSAPAEAPEPAGDDTAWGPAEGDVSRAFKTAQGYIARMSDLHDAARVRWEQVEARLVEEWRRAGKAHRFTETTATDACNVELNGLPRGRRSSPAMAHVLVEQDRILFRQIVEFRARYANAEAYARAIGQPMSSPMVQGLRHYFAAPLAEAEVRSRFSAMETAMADLIEKSSRERHRIEMAAYPDGGSGIVSPTRQRDLKALGERTAAAAAALCKPAQEAWQRGLVAYAAPVVPKVRAQLGN